jgi:anti-sigma B factor antagonist
MRVTQRRIGDGGVVAVDGKLTCLEPGDLLERAVAELALRGSRTIVADLANVRDMDGAGLGALVSACRASHRHYVPFRLVHVPRHIRRLIVVTGLVRVMEMFESLDEALDIPHARRGSGAAVAQEDDRRAGLSGPPLSARPERPCPTTEHAPYVRDHSSFS